jgi:deoxyribodipyrimidine photo-lyase
MTTFNDARVRTVQTAKPNSTGRYVLYWCQMYRRLSHNHALDYAMNCARHLKKPLVIFEGLKLNYPWASARFHKFMLDGMADNFAAAKQLGATYWPFVETPDEPGRRLVQKLCENACILVTDDYPQFIIPAQTRAVAAAVTIPVFAVDGNSMVPLALLGKTVGAAAHLRPRWHKLFAEAWNHRANAEPNFSNLNATGVKPPFKTWTPPADISAFVNSLPIDQTVPIVAGAVGGATEGRRLLAEFVNTKLHRYAEERSHPDDPAKGPASGLSWWMHYGHLSIQEIVEATLGANWTPSELNLKTRNKDDFFCRDANINGFLDEAITWRDVGLQWHYTRAQAKDFAGGTQHWCQDSQWPAFNFATNDFSPLPAEGTLAGLLPEWALATLRKHESDRRDYLYTLEQFESAQTHDPLWNAAQRELVATGRMNNYLRMLWAKKVLEWSARVEQAYRVLEHLNNKYAIDGRDPNSYTGILWCFGLFDRPWPPERKVFGNIRFMSSDSTAKKFKLAKYYEYIRRLPSVALVRSGSNAVVRASTLFDSTSGT